MNCRACWRQLDISDYREGEREGEREGGRDLSEEEREKCFFNN